MSATPKRNTRVEFLERFDAQRKKRGLESDRQAALQMGFDVSQFNRIKNGKAEPGDLQWLRLEMAEAAKGDARKTIEVEFPTQVLAEIQAEAEAEGALPHDIIRRAVSWYLKLHSKRVEPALNDAPTSAGLLPHVPVKPVDSTSASPAVLAQAVKYQAPVGAPKARRRAASSGGNSTRPASPPPGEDESPQTAATSVPT